MKSLNSYHKEGIVHHRKVEDKNQLYPTDYVIKSSNSRLNAKVVSALLKEGSRLFQTLEAVSWKDALKYFE
jgi:hypothetical protein